MIPSMTIMDLASCALMKAMPGTSAQKSRFLRSARAADLRNDTFFLAERCPPRRPSASVATASMTPHRNPRTLAKTGKGCGTRSAKSGDLRNDNLPTQKSRFLRPAKTADVRNDSLPTRGGADPSLRFGMTNKIYGKRNSPD